MTTPAAPYSYAQLLQTQSLTDLRVLLLSLAQGEGYPAITEWAGEPTGTEMTFVTMVCQAINQLAQSGAPIDQQIASAAAGRTLRWANGMWLDLLAEQVYQLTRDPATFTTFSMTLVNSNSSNAQTFTLQPGDVWVVGPTGNRYQSITGGNLGPGESLELAFQAENIGSAYADDPSQVTLQLVTTIAGVTLKAGGGDFTIVTNTAGSTGQLQPQRSNPATIPTPHTFSVQINVAGEIGAATYSLQIDDGAFVFQGLLNALNNLGDGTSIEAIAGVAPSFLEGDIFVFSTPGTPNYIQGDDVESDASLIFRCQARWPSLSLNVLDAKVILWTVTAYPGANRVSVAPDIVTPGRFIVTVADSHGSVDQASVDTIEAYIKPRLGVDEDMGAASAFTVLLGSGGNVRVPLRTSAADLEEIQREADIDWQAYLATVPISGTVVPAKLIEILMDVGALDVGDVTPLSVSTPSQSFTDSFSVDSGSVPVRGTPLSQALTWMFG